MDERVRKGMQAQSRIREARRRAGDTTIGWKVGFGAPNVMQRMGLEAPLLGFLTLSARLESGATLELSGFGQAFVEPEIAVWMGSDLAAGAGEAAVRAAIAGLGPAFEIADVTFPPEDIEKILANNVYQRGVIFGPMDPARAGADTDGLIARMSVDGEVTHQAADVQANTGRIVDLVRMVADTLAEAGPGLSAGEVIIAGSVVPPVVVDKPCAVQYELTPYRPLLVRFA